MGACAARSVGFTQGEPGVYVDEFETLQRSKRDGDWVPPPLPAVEWTDELYAEIEKPTIWAPLEHLDWFVKFQYPSSWNVVDPIVEENRLIRTVRTGFRHKENHIFCTCELSIVVTRLSDQFRTPDDFFDEVRILNNTSAPDQHQESVGTLDGHPAIVTTNTYLQDDGTHSRVIDKHAFLPEARLGITLVAFFADSDDSFHKYRTVANDFFESVRVTERHEANIHAEAGVLPDEGQ